MCFVFLSSYLVCFALFVLGFVCVLGFFCAGWDESFGFGWMSWMVWMVGVGSEQARSHFLWAVSCAAWLDDAVITFWSARPSSNPSNHHYHHHHHQHHHRFQIIRYPAQPHLHPTKPPKLKRSQHNTNPLGPHYNHQPYRRLPHHPSRSPPNALPKSSRRQYHRHFLHLSSSRRLSTRTLHAHKSRRIEFDAEYCLCTRKV